MKIIKKSLLILTLLILTFGCKKEEIEEKEKVKKSYSGDYVRKRLIEHFSIHNCPPCTTLLKFYEDEKKEKLMKQSIPVVISASSSTPMHPENYSTLKNKFEFKGVPAVFVNRVSKNFTRAKALEAQLEKEIIKVATSPISIKITSKLGQKKGTVNFDVQVNDDLSGLEYSVFILESGYKSNIVQKNAGAGFLHNNFLRNPVIMNKSFEFKKNEVKSIEVKEFEYKILTKIANLSVVVFVTDKSGQVIQAEIAKANKTAESLIAK